MKPFFYQHQYQTDPEVAEFEIETFNTDQSVYTHNMHIDYGKLGKPSYITRSEKKEKPFTEIQSINFTSKVIKPSSSAFHTDRVKEVILMESIQTH